MSAAHGNVMDLETKAAAGGPFTSADAERLLSAGDLIAVGMVGEAARRSRTGDTITFGRVAVATRDTPVERASAGEIRLVGAPSSMDEAVARVARAAAAAGGVPITGFSASDVLDLAGHDRRALVELAATLSAAGLESVAECAIDAFDTTDDALEVVQALERGGLGVWRLTVDRAAPADRLAIIERAAAIQESARTVRAFAPLARRDAVETPSTGYDDVRTIAAARVRLPAGIAVQVDWPLYGPKLAQVAVSYGANDVDGIAAADTTDLGPRRAPREDIQRQIRAAGGTPVERNGRYEPRA